MRLLPENNTGLRIVTFCLFMLAVNLILTTVNLQGAEEQTVIYEMRTYTAHPGKLDELLTRFRDHTQALFTKHGMQNVAYFTPVAEGNDRLIYFLAYPSREAREASWKGFMNDPEWKAAFAESQKDGPLVKKVESQFLITTDYSPTVKQPTGSGPLLFELRTYTATPGNLAALNSRFRDHTCELFARHGMQNVVYWNLMADQSAADKMLIYLIAHQNEETRSHSFKAFAADPDWQSAKAASEEQAGGSLTEKGGVKFEFLQATDFSPIK